MGFFNSGRGGSGSGGGTANVSDSLINGEILVNGEVVQVYNDTEVKNDVSDLKNNKHSHSNKTQLDRLGINGSNKLTIDGSEIGVGSTVIDSATNGNIVVNGVELTVYNDSSLASSLSAKASINDTTPSASTTFSSNKINTLLTEKANSTHPHVLADITDVDLTNKINGYALQYNSSTGKFESKALPTGGSGATSMSGLSDVDVTTVPPTDNQVLTYDSVTGKWVPETVSGASSSPTNVYIIELSRWGISSDGTNPVATTQGINNALVWAYNNNYNYVKLPAGTYTVAKGTMYQVYGVWFPDVSTSAVIQPQDNTVLDLYGCTIKKEASGQDFYVTMYLEGKKNITILGGTVVGDNDTHDFATISDSIHEGCRGIVITKGCRNIKLLNMDIHSFPGYNVDISGEYKQAGASGIMSISDWEVGTFNNDTGVPITNSSYMRLNKFLQLSNFENYTNANGGYFCVWGNGYSAFGTRYDGGTVNLSKTIIDIYCYGSTGTYLGKLQKKMGDDIYINTMPTGTTQFKMAFRYDITAIIPSTFYMEINTFLFSRNIEIRNCKIHDSFALAVAVTGAQHVIFENNEMYKIGWSTPRAGRKLYYFPMAIDIEDGGVINQHIIIRNNIFRDNESLHINAYHVRNLLIEYNKFYNSSPSSGVSFQGSRNTNIVSQYNSYNCTVAVGQGLTNVLFNYDHFISGNLPLNFESNYVGCTFDDMTFQLAMTAYDSFVAGNKYKVGDRAFPTTKNGFYYVCIAGSSEPIVVITEPTWKTDGTDTIDSAGNTWKSWPYNPAYEVATFRDCKFNYNRGESNLPGWTIRRGGILFDRCVFNINTQSNYFNDGSFGWDWVVKNHITFRDCELNIKAYFGNLPLDKVHFIHTKITGAKGVTTWNYPVWRANEVRVENCVIDSFDIELYGLPNSNSKSITFKDNTITISKGARRFGTVGAITEGILIRNFESVFIEGNKIILPIDSFLARPFTIKVEKFIKITDNYVESSYVNYLELLGAYRDGTYNLAAPTTVAVLDKNYVKSFTFNQDATFTSQLSQAVIGTPTTTIE